MYRIGIEKHYADGTIECSEYFTIYRIKIKAIKAFKEMMARRNCLTQKASNDSFKGNYNVILKSVAVSSWEQVRASGLKQTIYYLYKI